MATGLFARAFCGAVLFPVAFFFAAGFPGIGICMPGMLMDCADAGAVTVASASALAAAENASFTIDLQRETPP